MVVNLLDRELIPITREHTENACTAGYMYVQGKMSVSDMNGLLAFSVTFYWFLISNIDSLLVDLIASSELVFPNKKCSMSLLFFKDIF